MTWIMVVGQHIGPNLVPDDQWRLIDVADLEKIVLLGQVSEHVFRMGINEWCAGIHDQRMRGDENLKPLRVVCLKGSPLITGNRKMTLLHLHHDLYEKFVASNPNRAAAEIDTHISDTQKIFSK